MSDPTPAPTPTPTPTPDPLKAGVRTTEFWLSLLAVAIGAAVATGLVPVGGEAAKIAAFATMVLATLGYSGTRAWLKNAAPMLAVLVLGAILVSSTSCSANGREVTIKTAVATAKATEAGFVTWDARHQEQLLAGATSREDGLAKLNAYRVERDKVRVAQLDLYRLLLAAWQVKDALSIASAVDAATKLQKLIGDLEGSKP